MSAQGPKSLPSPIKPDDDVKWLALLIRRSLLVAIRGIEDRYGIVPDKRRDEREAA